MHLVLWATLACRQLCERLDARNDDKDDDKSFDSTGRSTEASCGSCSKQNVGRDYHLLPSSILAVFLFLMPRLTKSSVQTRSCLACKLQIIQTKHLEWFYLLID